MTARSSDLHRSSSGEPQVIHRLQRLAFVLSLAAILAAALIGWSAYSASRKAMTVGYFEDTQRQTQLSVDRLERSTSTTLDVATLEGVKRHFERRVKSWDGSYLCIMDEAGKLVLDTGDPSKEGLMIGLEPFRGWQEDGQAPSNLLQLLEERRNWVGLYGSLDGRTQMATFAYVSHFRALVAVHIPWDSVQHRINVTTIPWAIGFGLIVLLVGPLCLWGMSKAYADSERGAKRARAAERRAAEQVLILREIDRAILAGGSVRDIVRAALARIRALVPFSRASVILFDGEEGPGRLLAVDSSHATDLGEEATIPRDAMWIRSYEDLRAGQPNIVPDIDAYGEPSNVLRTLRAEGVRSFVNVPLTCRGALLGTLNLGFARTGEPSAEDLDLAREVADILALAVLQVRLHEELQKQAAELEKRVAERTRELSEVNAELEGYVHSVSHDLRAPLRAVHGFGHLLLDEVGPRLGPTEREYLERMVSASERMDALIRDLLAYSRLAREDVAVRPLDAQHVVEEARELLQIELAERRATLEVAEPMLPVVGHHPTLVQAIANLLSNAAKFVPAGVPPRIRVRTEPRGDRVRLVVEDNGIGIAPEHQEEIFRVFERLNGTETYPGTGIGLAIVRRAVERMGGTAGVESRPGEGSRFWIELPGAGKTA